MKRSLSVPALVLTLAMLMTACTRNVGPAETSSSASSSGADAGSTDVTTSKAPITEPETAGEEIPFSWNLTVYDGYEASAGQGFPDISDANGLLWYNFEEKIGATVLKSSLGAARDSIKVNATLVPEGGPDGSGAISFDGVDDNVKLNNDFTSVSQITPTTFLHPAFQKISVSLSFCPESLEGDRLLYEQGNRTAGLAIGIRDGKLIAAVGAGASATSAGTASVVGSCQLPADSAGSWFTVALTFDGSVNEGTAKLYLNGSVVASADHLGAWIPQTLDAAGIGGAVWGTNALGFTDAFYKGKMDDLRIYSTVIEPMGELEESAIYLQSASLKNSYIAVSDSELSCRSMADPSFRGWIPTVGLADSEGISFRLTGTDRFLSVADGKLTLTSLGTERTDAENQAATFYAVPSETVPSWGESSKSAFFRFYNSDRSLVLVTSSAGKLSLTSPDSADPLRSAFKATGDQTKVTAGLKGAVYYPSYALNAPQFWKWYDHAIIDRDMQYATEILGINSFRIWVSYEYWLEDPDHFEAGFNDFLELADKWGISIMVSLFEGCGDSYAYDSYSTWNRSYRSESGKSAGWAVTSPSQEIYNNRSRWSEPKEFVKWFMDGYKNDGRLIAIEIYNEPWGDSRTALALELCDYAVSMQGSVALTLGTAPSGGHTLPVAAAHGMDLLQYHDNFPTSTAAFESNAAAKIAVARLANLPVVCTEIQWVGGPSGINYPVYSNLAPTCEKLMEGGNWAPYYWTLMVHPCYLNSYRDNYQMYNGLINEDGTVNNLKNAQAVAGGNPDVTVSRVNPYTLGSYHYSVTFSDSFMDLSGYKWTGSGYSASTGAYVGSGIATANETDFGDFILTVDVSTQKGESGVLIRGSEDGKNGYLLVCDRDAGVLRIYKLTNGQKSELAVSSAMSIDGDTVSLTVRAYGSSLSIEAACTAAAASDESYSSGLIGVYASDSAAFDNVLAQKN
ncbi:MAG: LamG-like jellyroll fold domain-containing protein [Eubacteriales bacterium]